jgi:hypothetical protein
VSSQPLTLEKLLGLVEHSVRGDRRLLVQLFRTLQQLARLPSAPPDEQALGEVLSRVLMGDRQPDLTSLPPDVAEEVQAMLDRLKVARCMKG